MVSLINNLWIVRQALSLNNKLSLGMPYPCCCLWNGITQKPIYILADDRTLISLLSFARPVCVQESSRQRNSQNIDSINKNSSLFRSDSLDINNEVCLLHKIHLELCGVAVTCRVTLLNALLLYLCVFVGVFV